MENIKLKDKEFKPYLSEELIAKAVSKVAEGINADLKGKKPLFLVVLNGSFMFASDLLKKINLDCEISFVKLASYHGTTSSGTVSEIIGLSEDVTGRELIIVEDIVDSGVTIEKLMELLKKKSPANISIATLLFKPEAYKKQIEIKYRGIEIPNDFVVGYGLDYDGLGRNLSEIYILAH